MRNTLRLESLLRHGKILSHATMSPPAHMISQGMDVCQREGRRLMKDFLGIEGGVEMWHPTRINEDINGGRARFSPHLQGVYVGWVNPLDVKGLEYVTGWVYHANVYEPTGSAVLKTRQDIYSVLHYESGHCAHRKGRQAVSSWGIMHPKKLKEYLQGKEGKDAYVRLLKRIKDAMRPGARKCPLDGKEMYPVELADLYPHIDDPGGTVAMLFEKEGVHVIPRGFVRGCELTYDS